MAAVDTSGVSLAEVRNEIQRGRDYPCGTIVKFVLVHFRENGPSDYAASMIAKWPKHVIDPVSEWVHQNDAKDSPSADWFAAVDYATEIAYELVTIVNQKSLDLNEYSEDEFSAIAADYESVEQSIEGNRGNPEEKKAVPLMNTEEKTETEATPPAAKPKGEEKMKGRFTGAMSLALIGLAIACLFAIAAAAGASLSPILIVAIALVVVAAVIGSMVWGIIAANNRGLNRGTRSVGTRTT